MVSLSAHCHHHLPDTMPRVVDAYRLLADPLLVVIAADRADERPSPFGNWPPTASPCRRRRRTAGGPPCPAGLPRGRIHPFNAVRHHRHRAPTPPRPGRPRHCAHPPDGHRPATPGIRTALSEDHPITACRSRRRVTPTLRTPRPPPSSPRCAQLLVTVTAHTSRRPRRPRRAAGGSGVRTA